MNISYLNFIPIENIEFANQKVDMIDIEVEDDRTFVLDSGIVSHNSIGVIQHFTLGVSILNKRGIFGIKPLSNDEKAGILSTAEASIPFIDKNEPTRCIMATSQARQAVPVLKAEPPAVMTGYESILPTLLTDNFVYKSKCNGKVVKSTLSKIEIKCDKTGEIITYDLSEYKKLKTGQGFSIYSSFEPTVEVGETVKIGQIIANGTGVKNNIISEGINVLTAFMFWKGYVYEDGIVISESLANSGRLSSAHIVEVETIIKPGDKLLEVNIEKYKEYEPGDIILKYLPESISEVFNVDELDDDELFQGMVLKRSPGGMLIDYIIAPNDTLLKYPELKDLYDNQDEKYKKKPGSYTYKREKYRGVYIKLIFKKIFHIGVGDKLANRHGAKGVVTYIEKDENMPVTPDGQRIELITSPVGVIGRINLGQLFEMYTGLLSGKVANEILKIKNKGKIIRILKKLYRLLDGSKDKRIYTQFSNYLDGIDDKSFNKLILQIEKYKFVPIIIPPFQSPSLTQIKNALSEFGIDPEGSYLRLPEFGTKTKDKISYGYIYYRKLEHIAENKIYSRGLGTRFVTKLGQPTGGKAREGGQKVGEFDTWSLLGWGADNILKEIFGPLSDDRLARNRMIQDIIKSGNTSLQISEVTPTKDLVKNLLYSVGVQFE